MCEENESTPRSAKSAHGHPDDHGAGEGGSRSQLATDEGKKHPHEPPVVIEDGSFIIECDEDIIADGMGGPYGGGNRKRHKRRTPVGSPSPSIRCVRIQGGSLELPAGFDVNQPSYKLLVELARMGIRLTYPTGGCRINIYWDTHPCGAEHG